MDVKPIDELEKQRKYNSDKSKKYKRLYYLFGILAIVFSMSTTVILIVSDIYPLIPGIVSAISAILVSVSQFVGLQKHWVNCRFMTEALKSEKRKYLFEIAEYDGKEKEQKDKLLATNLDRIITKGNDAWKDIVMQTEEDDKK